jgi:hypothetical protein
VAAKPMKIAKTARKFDTGISSARLSNNPEDKSRSLIALKDGRPRVVSRSTIGFGDTS